MRFLSIWKSVETNVPPSPEMIQRMGELIEEMTRTGELIATEGCLPSALGARVRRAGSKVTVTDGPFTESKELIAGFRNGIEVGVWVNLICEPLAHI